MPSRPDRPGGTTSALLPIPLAAVMVLSVCSLKGGVGKTSAVLGLSSAALARGIPTLVVDLDPQSDATTGLAVAQDNPLGVVDLLRHPRRQALSRLLSPSGWTELIPGRLDVIAGSAQGSALDDPRANAEGLGRVKRGLSAAASDYDLVLLDCPPSLGALTRSAFIASNRALVVTEPALFAVTAADRALRAVQDTRRRFAPDLQPLGVMVNRFRERSPEHRYRLEELRELFGPLVLTPTVPERSALQQAQGASQPIHSWPGAAAAELAEAYDAHLARVLRVASRLRRG